MAAVKAIGGLKVVLIARSFGASDALDAFLVAFLLPTFFGETVAGSLATALIPALVNAREQDGRMAMERLRAGITVITLIAMAITGAILLAVSPLLLKLLAHGFDASKRAQAQQYLYYLLPLLPMIGLSTVWRAALNAEERFAIAALATGITPVLTAVLLLHAGVGADVWLLVWGGLAGTLLELLCLAAALRRRGLQILPQWYGYDPAIRLVVREHLPLVAVAAIGNGNVLIDQSMAAALGPGSVSALNYGVRPSSVLAGIAEGVTASAALPGFQDNLRSGDWNGVWRILRAHARLVLFLGIPITAILIALSPTLVRILFLRGQFTTDAAGLVNDVQQFSLLQLPAVIFSALLLRLLSSLRANALILRVSAVALVINLAGNCALMSLMGLPGIALSSSLAHIVSMGLLLVMVRVRMAARSGASGPGPEQHIRNG